jgi:hypothetical protein
MTLTNQERADRCEKAIAAYSADDARTNLVDLLTDAMHWCHLNRDDFRDALATAEMHFHVETTPSGITEASPITTEQNQESTNPPIVPIAKHTPGPWWVSDTLQLYSEATDEHIADLDTAMDELSPEAFYANGSLIAAAPDLLKENENRIRLARKALEEVQMGDLEKAEAYLEMIIFESALIAKVKGLTR